MNIIQSKRKNKSFIKIIFCSINNSNIVFLFWINVENCNDHNDSMKEDLTILSNNMEIFINMILFHGTNIEYINLHDISHCFILIFLKTIMIAQIVVWAGNPHPIGIIYIFINYGIVSFFVFQAITIFNFYCICKIYIYNAS